MQLGAVIKVSNYCNDDSLQWFCGFSFSSLSEVTPVPAFLIKLNIVAALSGSKQDDGGEESDLLWRAKRENAKLRLSNEPNVSTPPRIR
jgi:hypothetical protein